MIQATLIVPAYNGGEVLGLYLKSLCSQNNSVCELFAIDSSSSDVTVQLLAEAGFRVEIIPQSSFDHGGTRSYAAQKARGDIIIFTTQDVIFADKNAIANLVKAFDDPSVGAAYGRQLPHANADFFAKRLRAFNYPEQSYVRTYDDKEILGFKATFLSDSFSAYRKDVLEEIGYFANPIIFGEDAEAAARILRSGYKIAYRADATVAHSHNYTLSQEFRRYFDVGVFHRQYAHLLVEFGAPESEGVKYVLAELKELFGIGMWYLTPYSILKSGMKYLGYKLGKKYSLLPKGLVKKISMNKGYWK